MSLSTKLRLLLVAALAWTALAGLAAGDSAARRTTALADDAWIVISSNRDGVNRAYSVRSDGSRLTPLVAERRLVPFVVSRNGETIAYTTKWYGDGPIYVSRASGSGLHRVAKDNVGGPTLSQDGRWIAYSPSDVAVVWIVRADGRGKRRVLRCSCGVFDWSPNGKSLLLEAFKETADGATGSVVVLPLHGKRRVIARYGEDTGQHADAEGATWSQDGRWIAYLNTEDNERKIGLYVVRPNGKGLHRVVRGELTTVAWSPQGKKLAFTRANGQLGVVGVDGRGLRRVPLQASAHNVEWSPDGRRLAVEASSGDPSQIFVLGEDGREARRVTAEGSNALVGWTRRAPVLPPATPIPPSERVIDARSVATATPVAALSGDGTRVAFVPNARPSDCEHAAVWAPGESSIVRFDLPAPCPYDPAHVREVTLAGQRVAWTYRKPENKDECWVALKTSMVVNPQPLWIHGAGPNRDSCAPDYYHVRGDGELMVFDDEARVVRIGSGRETCQRRSSGPKFCTTVRRQQAGSVDSVSGTSMAVRQPGAVSIFDVGGQLVRRFPFSPADIRAARLDGGRLVVWRFGVLEVYDVATGARVLSRPVPVGFRLVDVDGGIAVLLGGGTINLLRLDDGVSRTLSPGGAPVLAELEPAGLFYSYAAGGGGRIVFVPRSELF